MLGVKFLRRLTLSETCFHRWKWNVVLRHLSPCQFQQISENSVALRIDTLAQQELECGCEAKRTRPAIPICSMQHTFALNNWCLYDESCPVARLWEKPPNDVSLVAYAKVAKVMPFNRCRGNINDTSLAHPSLVAKYFPLILNSNRKYLCRYLSAWEIMESDNRGKPYLASLHTHFSYPLICRISSAVFHKNKHFHFSLV